ncbi:class I SAM-dependent methyltransferase [Virgibacillus xinjiangensis]|uniref:Class I SAM-dependent methyltransferase n=1 Tax=Virgibacillus xinjiangensis TaxID=393090 RepID=A0ABV7CR63_9BACI
MGTYFPKLYDPLMKPLEQKYLGKLRSKLLSGRTGTILEVGSGTGLNFPYYDRADTVIAVEPDDTMREKSLARVEEANVPIQLLKADAEHLPFEDNTFDVVAATLVFCTIPKPDKALQEIGRVCKPGAPILFLEHVKVEGHLGYLQDWLTPVWKKLCDGCHLNRDTYTMVKNHFHITQVESFLKNIFLVIEAMNEKNQA